MRIVTIKLDTACALELTYSGALLVGARFTIFGGKVSSMDPARRWHRMGVDYNVCRGK